MADKIFFKTGLASSLPTTKTAGQLLFAIDGTTGSIYLDKDSNTRIKFNADAVRLATPRSINGTSFDGSADITTANWGTARNISISDATGANTGTVVSVNGSQAVTLKLPATIVAALKGNADTATKATTADSATTATTCTGNAATATKLKTGVAINGTTFDGSGAITTANWGTARTITISDNVGDYTQANTGINGGANFTLKLPATITASLIGNASSATYATTAGTADSAKTCTGNAATATKLKTGVAINGTTFDGSGAITTANWGTARTITISDNAGTYTQANTGINGSANFTLKLPATLAASITGNAATATKATTADSATTATSCTGNAATATKLKTGVAINGTTFDGSAAITTAKWGTARNVSIGNSDGTGAGTAVSVDGSGAVTLKLPTEIKANVTSAGKLSGDASDVGDINTPVYFEDGIPKPITSIDVKSDRAAKLDPGASINGTLFTGESNITTANWGTARNVTIKDASKTNTSEAVSVNGSDAFSLLLPATIKATLDGNAATATKATNADKATVSESTTGNAGTATKLKTAVAINGTNFDGSTAITTANWGTARDITIGGTKKTVNGSQAYSWSLNEIGALPGKTTSATTAATAGWYRIAITAASETNNLGQFTIQASPSGKHCLAIINAGISYGQGVNLQQMSFVNYTSSPILTKARIVYHTTYSGNYAYLEVYVSSATATPIYVQFTGFGWSLVAPSTAGSVPSGYSTKEITFVNNSIVSNLSGKATSAGSADTATKLTTPRAINGTNFDGTGAITTANWGTARTITISDNSESYTQANTGINGSADFTLKLPATIKATLKGKADTAGHADSATTATTATTTTGNAGTATKLATPRAINGTNFDGSGPITTANWGTARSVTIVSSDGTGAGAAVSVNGGDNFALKLPTTIKANLTGKATSAGTADTATKATTAESCTGNAATATKLKTPVAINGTDFDGSTAITTANWGTARNFTIKDADSTNAGTAVSVNGSGAVTLLLPATIKANITGKATSAGTADSATTATTATTCTGNAATATKLKTGATINGTTFDGSSAITTANWGTARTVTISDNAGTYTHANTGINGSANFTLKLPATLAASITGNAATATKASSADKATTAESCTGNAATATTLKNSRSINGTAFNGSGDITTAKWGTARTLSISSTAGTTGTSVDGSENKSLVIPSTMTGFSSITSTKLIATTVASDTGHVVFPDGGQYTTTDSAKTGYLKITLPVSWTNAMMRFYVDIYNYSTGTSATYMIGGYNYSSSSAWVNVYAQAIGTPGSKLGNLSVRFGHDGSKCAIYIGAADTSWNYPQVMVRDLYVGYSQDEKNYTTGWSIDFTTTLGTISATVENTNVAYKLYTARTINGTSFDGSGNITTANWGTSRNITIKDGSGNKGTAIAVNGSANVELVLPTTIAATVSAANKLTVNDVGDFNTPVYFEDGIPKPITSIDVKSDKAGKLDPGKNINGTLFTGESDITTAKWGTERTISINSAAGTTGTKIDGSVDKSLTIPTTLTGFTSITSTTFVGNLSGKATSAGTADSATTAASCTGNATTATQLKTARTIALAGDVTGSTSFDGSGNVSITTAVGNDTHSHTYSTISLLGSYVSNTALANLPNGITYVEMPATATTTGDPTYGTMLTVKYSTNRAFQIANSSAKLYFRPMHSTSFTSDAGAGYGPWKSIAISDGGTYTMNITGNASGTAGKLATARNITISGAASSSIGTFDGSANTTIYIPTTISGFESISTKKIVSPASTALYITPTSTLYLDSGASTSIIFRQGGTARARFDTSGYFTPEANNTYYLGTSSLKWKGVYATTFYGALSGNATTATTLATSRAFRISDTANSTSTASFNGSADATLYIPTTIKGFTSIESDKYVVNDKVTLQYNTTNECLEFVFA